MQETRREILDVSEMPGKLRRRWFTSEYMDLFVWVDQANEIQEFQLCHNKDRCGAEKVLSWKSGSGYFEYCHLVVDGEDCGEGLRHQFTLPLFGERIISDGERVSKLFCLRSLSLPSDIRDFVTGKLREYNLSMDIGAGRVPGAKSFCLINSPFVLPN